MANRILLPNGCSMSRPSVTPKDWQSGGRNLLKRDWQIQYRFFDPDFEHKWTYGKLIPIRGMNSYKDLNERREVTKVILNDELEANKRGYNPILKRYVVPEYNSDTKLHEHLPFIDAFRIALTKIDCSKDHHDQIKWAINRLEKSAKKLKYDAIPISSLKRRELKRMLEACELPDNYFNKFRTYISALFTELIEYECCDTNLTRDIRKKKIIKNKREVLSPGHFKIVMKYLKGNYYEFWRYSKIFMLSGARTTELFLVQAKNVDLDNQEYKVTIKKGKQYTEVTKVILKQAIPYWREILKKAKPNDFLFSKGLQPGPVAINSDQITKRWYRLVKKSGKMKDENGETLKITADFYALKHAMLDSLPIEIAQLLASHTTSGTTSIYQVGKEKRDREILKKLEV